MNSSKSFIMSQFKLRRQSAKNAQSKTGAAAKGCSGVSTDARKRKPASVDGGVVVVKKTKIDEPRSASEGSSVGVRPRKVPRRSVLSKTILETPKSKIDTTLSDSEDSEDEIEKMFEQRKAAMKKPDSKADYDLNLSESSDDELEELLEKSLANMAERPHVAVNSQPDSSDSDSDSDSDSESDSDEEEE